MPLFSFEGKAPRVHPTAFVAPTATLIGDVVVEERASVDRKSTRLNSSHIQKSRMPSSA